MKSWHDQMQRLGDELDRARRPEVPVVVYVAGAQRSGSTLLDLTLGEYDGAFSAGELQLLWEAPEKGRLCGCGGLVADCPIWSEVLKRVLDEHPSFDSPAAIERLHQETSRTRSTPRLVPPLPLSAHAAQYRSVVETLHESLADVTGASVIIDSSKRPVGAAQLRGSIRTTPVVIQLVRDPRAVVQSESVPRQWKDVDPEEYPPVRSTLGSIGWWLTFNGLSETIRLSSPGLLWLTVRYEDYVEGGKEFFDTLAGALGLTGPSPFTDPHSFVRHPNHTVAGNPIRFKHGPTKLGLSAGWRREMPPAKQRLVSALTLPGKVRYDY